MALAVNEKETEEYKAETKAAPVKPFEFLKEVRTEFIKISWPSREQVIREFFSVVLLVAVLTGTIFIIDKIISTCIDFFSGKLFY